jgi:hypothetical protein
MTTWYIDCYQHTGEGICGQERRKLDRRLFFVHSSFRFSESGKPFISYNLTHLNFRLMPLPVLYLKAEDIGMAVFKFPLDASQANAARPHGRPPWSTAIQDSPNEPIFGPNQ